MKLYHGTNTPAPIIAGNMRKGTWLAGNLFHAFRIAERRKKQRGGKSIVVEIDVDASVLHMENSRNLPTYKFNGGAYKATNTPEMVQTKI